MTAWSMVSQPPVIYGDARLPALLCPSTMFTPWCSARCIAATSLLLLFMVSFAMGPGSIFSLGFAAAVVVALAVGGDSGEGATPVAHFGFPAEFHLVNEEDSGNAGMGRAERPQVRVRVCPRKGRGLWNSYPLFFGYHHSLAPGRSTKASKAYPREVVPFLVKNSDGRLHLSSSRAKLCVDPRLCRRA